MFECVSVVERRWWGVIKGKQQNKREAQHELATRHTEN